MTTSKTGASVPMPEDPFEWKEPPPDNRGRGSIRRGIVDRLKTQPGTWALVAIRKDPSFATSLKQDGCETTTRKREDEMYDIYARFPEEPQGTE